MKPSEILPPRKVNLDRLNELLDSHERMCGFLDRLEEDDEMALNHYNVCLSIIITHIDYEVSLITDEL